MAKQELVPTTTSAKMVIASGVDALLAQIRPEWQSKSLIQRVKSLLVVDPAAHVRKDLEHEDDQYEAGVEDCVYVFRTCIEIVLSRDPISPVRVTEVKDIIESPEKVSLSKEVLDDFASAPDKRQLEIAKFLISVSRNEKEPDIVRQNAIEALRVTSSHRAEIRPHADRSAHAGIAKGQGC